MTTYQQPTCGQIAYFGLTEWWEASFSDEERTHILSVYLGGDNNLTDTPILMSSGDPMQLISTITSWLSKEEDRHIAYKCIDKLEQQFEARHPTLSKHFAMHAACKILYRWREKDEDALPRAIEVCRRSISISRRAIAAFRKSGIVPSHYCFQQLSIIEEKRQNFRSAIDLCDKAERDGWAGDWPSRRARLLKKSGTTS